MKKRYINELIDSSRGAVLRSGEVLLPDADRVKAANRVNLLALGDVGGTVLMGLRLLGGEAVGQIGIYDLDPAMMRRYEMEINQICFPDGRTLPEVRMLEQDELFDCDMFVFCASKGVPPVGAAGDVRMAQLEANSQLVGIYADMAVKAGFGGIFAVVSDPVDPLCKAAVLSGLAPEQVQGYGLGVMNGRASYFAAKDQRFSQYLRDGRAFGPHGADLVIETGIDASLMGFLEEFDEKVYLHQSFSTAHGNTALISPITFESLCLVQKVIGCPFFSHSRLPRIRVMAELAAHRTPLQEYQKTDAWSIYRTKALYTVNKTFHAAFFS